MTSSELLVRFLTAERREMTEGWNIILLPAAAASGEREGKINVLLQSNDRWMSPSVIPKHRRNHLSAVCLWGFTINRKLWVFSYIPIYPQYSSVGAVKCMSLLYSTAANKHLNLKSSTKTSFEQFWKIKTKTSACLYGLRIFKWMWRYST